MNIGTSVLVSWCDKTLHGEVVENTTKEGPLAGMVAVRIPLMGCHPVALFTPGHVKIADGVIVKRPMNNVPVSDAWKRIQEFKAEHWDQEHNRLRIDAVDEFYQMWRESVAGKGNSAAAKITSNVEAKKVEPQLPPIVYKKPTKRITGVQLELF